MSLEFCRRCDAVDKWCSCQLFPEKRKIIICAILPLSSSSASSSLSLPFLSSWLSTSLSSSSPFLSSLSAAATIFLSFYHYHCRQHHHNDIQYTPGNSPVCCVAGDIENGVDEGGEPDQHIGRHVCLQIIKFFRMQSNVYYSLHPNRRHGRWRLVRSWPGSLTGWLPPWM